MKRIFSVLLCFLFVFSLIPSPASADDVESYIELLDYGVADEYGSNTASWSGTQKTFTYNLPTKMVVSYVDILFTYRTGGELGITVDDEERSRGSLSVINVSSNLFRAYGSISANYSETLKFNFISDSAVSSRRITIESIKVSNLNFASNTVGGNIIGYSIGQYVENSWGTEAQRKSIEFPIPSADGAFYEVNYRVDSAYWKKYDFLTFTIALDTMSVDSINVSAYGGSVVPFELSYLSSLENKTQRVVNIVADLRNLDRTYDKIEYINLYVSGTLYGSIAGSASIYHCYGTTFIDAPSPDLYWYQRLWQSIESGFSSLIGSIAYEFNTWRDQFSVFQNDLDMWLGNIWIALGGNVDDDQFQDDLEENKDHLDDLSDTLGSVTPPDISGVNLNVNGLVNPNVVTLTTSGISTVLSNEIILKVLIISATFAVAGFILYGKK